MQAAQDWNIDDLTNSCFALALVWRAWDPLVYPLMRPACVVEGCVFSDNAVQMPLTQNDHVIQAFPTERPYESLTVPIRLGSSYWCWNDSDPSSVRYAQEPLPILVVIIFDQEPWSFTKRRRLAHLLGNPVIPWRPGDIEVHHPPATHLDDHINEDGPKKHVVGLQEVTGPDI